MTSGFSLPFPSVGHPDNPEFHSSLIFAFDLWIQAKLDATIHKSKSRYGGNFFLWDIEDGGIKLSPEFVHSHSASAAFNVSAPDTARMAPNTSNDYYWEGGEFDLRAVFEVHGKEETSIILRYGKSYDTGAKIERVKNPIWQYAKDCVEVAEPRKLEPPLSGVGDLKALMNTET
jgi:hypothetical protein